MAWHWRRRRKKREVHTSSSLLGREEVKAQRRVKTKRQRSYHGNRKRARLVKHETPIKLYWSIVTMEHSHKHTQIRTLTPRPSSDFLFSIINQARVELGKSSTVVSICSLLSSANPGLVRRGEGGTAAGGRLPEAC